MFQASYHALIYKRTNGTACPLLYFWSKKFVVHQKEFVAMAFSKIQSCNSYSKSCNTAWIAREVTTMAAKGSSGRVVVGVLGGGQLGRMLAEAAHNSRELTVLPLYVV
jgi:hypothetical protein